MLTGMKVSLVMQGGYFQRHIYKSLKVHCILRLTLIWLLINFCSLTLIFGSCKHNNNIALTQCYAQ